MEPPDDATSSHEGSVSVKVAVRARPLSSSEKAQGCRDILHLHRETVDAGGENRTFDYDYVFGTGASQADIYEQTTVPLLNRVFEGFNATILAYGQTGSGKTFTMGTAFGGNGGADADASAGIVPRAVHELFARRARMASHRKVDVRLSFLEIHHEEIHDLLAPSAGAAGHGDGFETAKPSGHGLAVRESTEGAIVVAGLSSHTVATAADVERLLAVGTVGRATGSTAMNAASSRSHAVCTLTLEVGFAHSDAADDGAVEHVGKLTLVDLAGSERAKRTGASGNRLKEGISINRGLLALGNVISVLADAGQGDGSSHAHVPYRDSKLTRILQDSLGGSSHTLVLACVSPADANLEETVNTLRYAARARAIRNAALKNSGPTAASAAANALAAAECVVLRKEVRLLRVQLTEALRHAGSSGGVGSAPGSAPGGDASASAAFAAQGVSALLRRQLAETEARLRSEGETSLQCELKVDRLRLREEQLLAAAKAQGVTLLHSRASAASGEASMNPLLSLEDDQGEENDNVAGQDKPVPVLEEQRREIRKLQSELSDLKRVAEGAAEASERRDAWVGDEEELADAAVTARQEEHAAMELEERCMEALRVQFAGAVARLQAEVDELQREKVDDGKVAAGGGHGAKDPEAAARAASRVKQLEEKLKELERKEKEHARVVSLKLRAEAEAARLQAEVAAAKRHKADLAREAKADAARHAKELADGKRQTARLARESAKTGAQLAAAQAAQDRTAHMLRLKHQEVASAMRRIKEQQLLLAGGAKAAGAVSSSSVSSSKRLAGLRQMVEHEFNMGFAVANCRALLQATVAERAALQAKLGTAHRERNAAECAALAVQVAQKNDDIDELQDGVLATAGGKSGSEVARWAGVGSMGDAKVLLEHLLQVAVGKRAEAASGRHAAELRFQSDLAAALEEQQQQLDEAHGGELRSLRREMTEKMVLALQASSAGQAAGLSEGLSGLQKIAEGDGEEEEEEKVSAGSEAAAALQQATAAENAALRAWQAAASEELAASREHLERADDEVATLKAQIEREHKAAAAAQAEPVALPPTPLGKALVSSQEAPVGAAGRTPKKGPAVLVASELDDDDDDEESDFSEEEELFSDDDAEEEDDEEPDEEWTPAMEKAQTSRRAAAAARNKSALSSSGRLSTSPSLAAAASLDSLSLDTSPESAAFTAQRFARTLSSFDGALATARHRMSLDSNGSFGDASDASADTVPTAAGRAKKAAGHSSKLASSLKRDKTALSPPLPDTLAALTVAALKELCRARGVAVSGRKQDLLDRLDAFAAQGSAAVADVEAEQASQVTAAATGPKPFGGVYVYGREPPPASALRTSEEAAEPAQAPEPLPPARPSALVPAAAAKAKSPEATVVALASPPLVAPSGLTVTERRKPLAAVNANVSTGHASKVSAVSKPHAVGGLPPFAVNKAKPTVVGGAAAAGPKLTAAHHAASAKPMAPASVLKPAASTHALKVPGASAVPAAGGVVAVPSFKPRTQEELYQEMLARKAAKNAKKAATQLGAAKIGVIYNDTHTR